MFCSETYIDVHWIRLRRCQVLLYCGPRERHTLWRTSAWCSEPGPESCVRRVAILMGKWGLDPMDSGQDTIWGWWFLAYPPEKWWSLSVGIILPNRLEKKVPNHQPASFQTKPCWWVKDMMDTRSSSGNVRIIYQNIQQLLICSWLDPRPRFTQLTKRQPIVTIGNHHPK